MNIEPIIDITYGVESYPESGMVKKRQDGTFTIDAANIPAHVLITLLSDIGAGTLFKVNITGLKGGD